MKTSRFLIAAIALLGVAACQKVETPEAPQEEPEVVAPEVAAEPEQAPTDVNSVAAVLNEVMEKKEVRVFFNDIYYMIREGKDSRHFEFSIAPESGKPASYISGSLRLVRGDLHPIVIDIDVTIMTMVPIKGTLDFAQVANNYAKAAASIDDMVCEWYLWKASQGFDFTIAGVNKICFLRGEDEEGNRTMKLYVYDPNDPSVEPQPLPFPVTVG
jgi:hypothetical protein